MKMPLNKETIINEAFDSYNLSAGQKTAIKITLDGYVDLIRASTTKTPSKREVRIFVDLIKSNLVNTLNVLNVS
jgi:hypothetical protein